LFPKQQKEGQMDTSSECLEILANILEHSDVFKHKDDDILEGLSLAEVHCVDRIGSIDQPNVTKIANSMRLTRGAISKVCKKLIGKAIIEDYQDPSNRKEVYFRLTESGRTVFHQHQRVHGDVRQAWQSLFEHYSDIEQEAIRRFLSDMATLLVSKDDADERRSASEKKDSR
jgi:DNA-binding MarR family transcriptional regulator